MYNINGISERKTRGENPIYYSKKKNKVPGINLSKEVKDLYSENYRTWRKEIKEDRNKWKHILCSWIGRNNIITVFILPKAILRFNSVPIKIPMSYFRDLEQIFQKCICNQKPP